MTVIDNNVNTFEDKIVKCISVVCEELGIVAPMKSHRKFLIRSMEAELVPILPHGIFV